MRHSKVPGISKVLITSPPTVPMTHQGTISITLHTPSNSPLPAAPENRSFLTTRAQPSPQSSVSRTGLKQAQAAASQPKRTQATRLMLSLLLRCRAECREGGHQDILGTIMTLKLPHPPNPSSPTPVTASSSCQAITVYSSWVSFGNKKEALGRTEA